MKYKLMNQTDIDVYCSRLQDPAVCQDLRVYPVNEILEDVWSVKFPVVLVFYKHPTENKIHAEVAKVEQRAEAVSGRETPKDCVCVVCKSVTYAAEDKTYSSVTRLVYVPKEIEV